MMIFLLVSFPLLNLVYSCPPNEGIYLMLGGQCISNGTYFRDSDLQIAKGQDGYIHCVLPNETFDEGQWLRPDGGPVDCTTGGTEGLKSHNPKLKDPFFCTNDSTNANITLFLLNDDYFNPNAGLSNTNLNENIETEYKCCLPTSCSDPNTNIMTINVFERVYITDIYVDLPSDITAIPQYYTVHCIVTGSLNDATIKHYYDDTSDIELTQSYCTDTHDGYSCSIDSQSITTNYTYYNTSDYTVTVEWEGKSISNGAFRQSLHDGDHVHVCTAASAAIKPKHKGRTKNITLRAPSSSPIISMIFCECNNSIIKWTYPDNDIVDGYVVSISNHTDYSILTVSGGSTYQTTLELEGLSVGLYYNITVRAYQDILGPPSEPMPYCLEDYWNCECNDNTITMLKQNVSLISTPYLLETSVQDSIVLLGNTVTTSSYPSPNHVDLKSSSLLISIPVKSQRSFISGNSMTSLLFISSTSSTTANATMRVINSDGSAVPISAGIAFVVITIIITSIVILVVILIKRKKSKLTEKKMKNDEEGINEFELTRVTSSVQIPDDSKSTDCLIAFKETSTSGLSPKGVDTQADSKQIKQPEENKHHQYENFRDAGCDDNITSTYSLLSQPSVPDIDPIENVEEGNKEDGYERIRTSTCNAQPIYTVINKPKKKPTVPIPVIIPTTLDNLHSFILNISQDNNTCNERFEKLYDGSELECIIGTSKDNKPYNRFKNIVPYDSNRIKLNTGMVEGFKDCKREYVNASYIDGYNQSNRYIATQGPNNKTVVDFWRLVWQEGVLVIVMLTNIVENGQIKCEQYLPLEKAESYGPIAVSVTDERILPFCTVKVLNVQFALQESMRIITHLHYTKWPDHGVPDSVSPMMKFHQLVMKTFEGKRGPMLVHCSAGVGRTGTFISVDLALEQGNEKGEVDIDGIVTRLRQQRAKMIQNQAQYLFVHQLVLESVLCGNTSIPCSQFTTSLQQLNQCVGKEKLTKIQKQYKLLDTVIFSKHLYITAMENKEKNRTEDNLPSERHRVMLRSGNSNYINAVFIPGYKELKPYIIAQSPMENTAKDFWHMIHDYKVTSIVMCCNENENCCFPYWSTPDHLGYHTELLVALNSGDGFVSKRLKISLLEEELHFEATLFSITNWPDTGVVQNPQTILNVIEHVIKVQQKNGGRVAVHCSDTVGRSAVYCAVSTGLEQCKAEGEIDVFQVVKAIRMNKPGAIANLDQYSSIYQVLERYLEETSLYDNFK